MTDGTASPRRFASQTSAAHGTSPFAPRCSVQHLAHRVPCLFAVVFDMPHLGAETAAMLKESNLSVDVLRQIQDNAVKGDVALIMANVLENTDIVPNASQFGAKAKGCICLPQGKSENRRAAFARLAVGCHVAVAGVWELA